MNKENVEYSAAALYDGGWRSEDKKELIAEHGLTQDEADDICEELQKLEDLEKEQNNEQ